MAQEYINLTESNDHGVLALNSSVFNQIAEISIGRVQHCYPAKENKSVVVKINQDKLVVNVDVRLARGINIQHTCEQLQNKIYTNIFHTTEVKASEINIKVVGFVDEEKKDA